MPQDTRPSVMIAVPNMGQIHDKVVTFLLQAVLQPTYRVVVWRQQAPLVPHDSARNVIAQHFIEKTDCDFLLTVDADIVPPANILDMIQVALDTKLPIISGVCFVFNGSEIVTTCCEKKLVDGKEKLEPMRLSDGPEPLFQVDYVGAGCMLYRRGVIQRLREKEQNVLYQFHYEDGCMWMGEDYSFCDVARKHGYTIHVDRRFVCGHYKSVDLKELNTLLDSYWKNSHQSHGTDRNGDGRTDAGESAPAPGGTS